MSHLHIPDGVLPLWVWASCLVAALAGLIAASLASGPPAPRDIAFRGALGALVVTAMSLQIPLGPVEYHLSLLGPLGVLLGPAPAYLVLFVVATMLAAVGHGGITVIGANVMVLGLGAMLARPVYVLASRRLSPGPSMAWAAGASQAVAGAAWVAMVRLALGSGGPAAADAHGHAAAGLPIALGAVAVLWAIGVAVEATVAFGLGRFLARVKPELLPRGMDARPASLAAGPVA